MNFSITRNRKRLKKSLYSWDGETKTLSTNEKGLVLDFSNINDVTFRTGSNCTFNTGHGCIFNTIVGCTFNTGDNCTFETSYSCIFKTGSECVIIRRDVYEIIEIPVHIRIRLNDFEIKGYTIIPEKETIRIGDGKYYKDEVKEKLAGLMSVYPIITQKTIIIDDDEYYKDEVEERLKELKPVR